MLIQLIMKFLRRVCNIKKEKFRGHIHIHPHLDYKKAEQYWSEVSGIPIAQFYKTYRIPSKASKQKKDSLPNGTFDIYVNNRELLLKLQGWTEKIHQLAFPGRNMLQNKHVARTHW